MTFQSQIDDLHDLFTEAHCDPTSILGSYQEASSDSDPMTVIRVLESTQEDHCPDGYDHETLRFLHVPEPEEVVRRKINKNSLAYYYAHHEDRKAKQRAYYHAYKNIKPQKGGQSPS
jgi:hypothetical protein